MPLLNRAVELAEEVAEWRRELHTMPEILYDVHQTAAFVAEKLKEFGVDTVETGIGRTGVVGIIKGNGGDGPVVGLRAERGEQDRCRCDDPNCDGKTHSSIPVFDRDMRSRAIAMQALSGLYVGHVTAAWQ